MSGQLWAELPFADGAFHGSYSLGWFVNGVGHDEDCGFNGKGSLACAAAWKQEKADRSRLARELWREPLRQALASWSEPAGNQPPAPTITSPSAGSYGSESTVALRGSAIDPEGDPITYKWKATLGGITYTIGTSKDIDWVPLDTLGPRTAGGHTVVLTLEVSDGSASRSTNVTIGVAYPPA